jgi:hypothetical protein
LKKREQGLINSFIWWLIPVLHIASLSLCFHPGYGGWIRGRGNRVGNAFCWGSLAILLWLIHSNLQGRDFALICGLFGSAGSARCEWGRMENMCFLWLALWIWVVLNTPNVTRKDEEANCVMLWEKYDR